MLVNNTSRDIHEVKESNSLGLHERFQVAFRRFDKAYFPFAWFKDCEKGSQYNREKAFEYNKENKDIILPFLRAWILRGIVSTLGLLTAENLQSLGQDTTLLQASFAIVMTLCMIFTTVMWVGWLGLTYFRR